MEETLTYCDFSFEHWTRIRTDNVIDRLNREIGRHIRVVGLRQSQTLQCRRDLVGQKDMNRKHSESAHENGAIAARFHLHRGGGVSVETHNQEERRSI